MCVHVHIQVCCVRVHTHRALRAEAPGRCVAGAFCHANTNPCNWQLQGQLQLGDSRGSSALGLALGHSLQRESCASGGTKCVMCSCFSWGSSGHLQNVVCCVEGRQHTHVVQPRGNAGVLGEVFLDDGELHRRMTEGVRPACNSRERAAHAREHLQQLLA